MLSFIWPILTSRLAGPIGAAMAVVLALSLCASCVTQKRLEREILGLRGSIEAPVVGWRARLDQCHANVSKIEGALSAANDATLAIASEGAARLQAAGKELAKAQIDTATANRRVKAFMAAPAVGDDACARSLDARDKVLELLK